MRGSLTIGQAARATGVAAKTIRYYEQIGVLPAPPRTASGYRRYDERSVERLRLVGRARALGLPLRDVGVLASALNGGPRPRLRRRLLALVRAQLSAVHHRIGELERLRQELERVSRRMLKPPRAREGGPCRCLETDGTR
jgi:DNA-binding transcriptional MerR regulator